MTPRRNRQRVLVTGASGQVGGAVAQELASTCEVLAPSSSELNLADPARIRHALREARPDWIINAAAYTGVDKAESERELAWAINAQAPKILGEEASTLGCPLLHFSTDYVFDGTKRGAYTEEDRTSPINAYGAGKRAGEEALEKSEAAFLNFRTSWVYGATGRNFLRTILSAAQSRDLLRIVDDQHGAPTSSRDLARMVAHVISQRSQVAEGAGILLAEAVATIRGTYHAASAGETTWYGFAAQALETFRTADPAARLAVLEPILTDAYPTAAKRPLNSRLDCTKLRERLGWSMPEWRSSLAAVMSELLAGN